MSACVGDAARAHDAGKELLRGLATVKSLTPAQLADRYCGPEVQEGAAVSPDRLRARRHHHAHENDYVLLLRLRQVRQRHCCHEDCGLDRRLAPTVGVFDNSSGNLFDLTVALDDASLVSLAIQHEERLLGDRPRDARC
jgi:hypothetical protein